MAVETEAVLGELEKRFKAEIELVRSYNACFEASTLSKALLLNGIQKLREEIKAGANIEVSGKNINELVIARLTQKEMDELFVSLNKIIITSSQAMTYDLRRSSFTMRQLQRQIPKMVQGLKKTHKEIENMFKKTHSG
jgi:hypothetical protein